MSTTVETLAPLQMNGLIAGSSADELVLSVKSATMEDVQTGALHLAIEADHFDAAHCSLPITAPPTPSPRDSPFLPVLRTTSLPSRARVKVRAAVDESPVELPPVHSKSALDLMVQLLTDVDIDECEAHGENAFFVCDLARVYRANQRWERALGRPGGPGRRVEPFFAVKCNPDPLVLRLLAALGLGFDCASHSEISNVLSLGVDPSRIIYANPCKAASFVRNAAASGVDLMTFDNADELAKCHKHHPRAKLVLRLLTDDSGSVCRLGAKFGAHPGAVRPLLTRAKELGLEVVGVSFHVGSGCTNPLLYADALERAARAFDIGAELGYHFDLLDVGGGFQDETFETMAGVIKSALEDYFPLSGRGANVRVIAEPGRFYVTEAFELATNVIARRGKDEEEELSAVQNEEERPVVMYYINDGVYGAFNCTLFDHQVVSPVVITLDGGEIIIPNESAIDSIEKAPASIWGPTCDSIDLVVPRTMLPTGRLNVGDWLRWPEMGAYTVCAASQFNGFRRSLVNYTIGGTIEEDGIIRSLLAQII